MEQLLAVLPAESVAALPIACRPLMINPLSPIFDLYGSDAPIDPNGKHLPWLWVLLLPFVDEKRVVKAFNEYKIGLTVDECRRNAFGVSLVFLHSKHKLAVETMEKIRYRPVGEVDNDVLKALAIEDGVLLAQPGKWQFAISFAAFPNEEGAIIRLNQLKEKGVKSAKILKRAAIGETLLIQQADEKLVAALNKLHAEFTETTLSAIECKSP